MPNYEFKCQNCKKKFAVTMSLKEREEGKIKCPKCRSVKNQPIFGSFYSKTSKKS
jgi:putative FmdB family regulatory protein